MAGALVYEPDGSDAHLVFQLRPGAYNDETLIEFLTDLDQLEQHRSVVDARKIEKTLGWQPKTSLDAGLDATVRYFREARPASPAASVRPA